MDSNFNIYKRTSFQRPQLPREFVTDGIRHHQEHIQEVVLGLDRNANTMADEILEMDTIVRSRSTPAINSGLDDDNNYGEAAGYSRNRGHHDLRRVKTHGNRLCRRIITLGAAFDTVDSLERERHAEEIVMELEQDSNLMEDSPACEQRRRDVVREIPQSLCLKRCVKVKLTKSVSQKSKHKPIGCFKRMKYRMSFSFSKFKSDLKNLGSNFELWSGTLKSIEGHFGSGVASYFKLLRYLFLLNVIVAAISVVFIVVPQICFDLNAGSTSDAADGFEFSDIFTGAGSFENSILYYGFYTNNTTYLAATLPYSIPNAYFFTMLFMYFICFVVLSYSGATSYRRSFIETEGGPKNVYANKIFCGWDYGIATKKAADLRSAAIYNELKELLSESMTYKRKQSWSYKLKIFLIQFIINTLVLVGLFASGYVMWILLDKYDYTDVKNSRMILPAIAINFVMLLFPLIFSYIVKYECYRSPRTVLNVTLFRTYILGFIIVSVLVGFWLIKAKDNECWESSLGEEIYRLILFDFIISTVLTTLIEFISFLSQKIICCKLMSVSGLEFNIARHTLQIIYNQTLFWVGLFFSPLIPVIVVIKFLITWYIRSCCLHKFCQPPTKSWRAAQTQTWFLIMTLLSLLVIIVMHGYIVFRIQPSTSCGPFREYAYIYEIVTKAYVDQNHIAWRILTNVTKPGVVGFILIALCIPVYYLRAKAQSERAVVQMLREMLMWQAKDKKFLTEYINQYTNGHWDKDF